jgi:hypothetical protein
MSLPHLSEIELKEMNEDLIQLYYNTLWFLEVSGLFFDNMYGNIYENDE